jgi:hypothetical protein
MYTRAGVTALLRFPSNSIALSEYVRAWWVATQICILPEMP